MEAVKTVLSSLKLFAQKYCGEENPRSKSASVRLQQAVFIVFVLFTAFFARNNPSLVYPQIPYLLGLFMVSNLAVNYSLANFKTPRGTAHSLVVWNCALITGVVYYSGGMHSYLWVLYLLPIFAAATMLSACRLVSTAFICLAANGFFYSDLIGGWDPDVFYELAGKSALLVTGAMLMRSLSAQKDKAERELQTEREKLDKMSCEVAKQNLAAVRTADMAEVGRQASTIMHDLGTPMTVILGSARLLLEEEQSYNKADIQRILDAALHCRNILSSGMGRVKGQQYAFTRLDLREIVEYASAIATPILAQSGVSLRCGFKEKTYPMAGSETHLARLFLNLMMNARDAMPKGGDIVVAVSSGEGNWHEAKIEDTGPGFPEALIKEGPKAFATTKSGSGGTGLGLVISKEITEKHGGQFALSNRRFGGARISLRFPAAAPQAVSAGIKTDFRV